MIHSFAKVYKINQEEMTKDLHSFLSLHDLFTRALRKDVRPIPAVNNVLISPVDGVLESIGKISPEKSIIVKGKSYSIQEMLGDDERIQKYLGGTFLILYLSPSHYHRIHSPIDGYLISQYALGVNSYPVNRFGLKYGKSPLSKNYRVISELEHPKGHIALVKVGAMFINSIECTAKSNKWKKGDEIAYFSFGSTVVLLIENSTFTIREDTPVPRDVKIGEILGRLGN